MASIASAAAATPPDALTRIPEGVRCAWWDKHLPALVGKMLVGRLRPLPPLSDLERGAPIALPVIHRSSAAGAAECEVTIASLNGQVPAARLRTAPSAIAHSAIVIPRLFLQFSQQACQF